MANIKKIKVTSKKIKTTESEIELKNGIEIEYYGEDDWFINNPIKGVIVLINGKYQIDWKDNTLTSIDENNSEWNLIKDHIGLKKIKN